MEKAIVLVSGGLDSYVTAHYVKKRLEREVKLLFFDYGQKALEEELWSVKNLAKELDCELEIVKLPWLGKISTSFINKEGGGENKISDWYVPCRNSIFLISALAFAESYFIKTGEESEIYLGIKYEGELRFKDTTKEFIENMNELSKETTQRGFKIIAPFIDKDKEDIIELGEEMGIDLSKSYSCYLGAKRYVGASFPLAHCGKCAGCLARKKGFKFSKVEDKTVYLD